MQTNEHGKLVILMGYLVCLAFSILKFRIIRIDSDIVGRLT